MKTTRRIISLLKKYFIFNKTERKGIYGLLLVMVIIFIAPKVYQYLFPPEFLSIQITELPLTYDNKSVNPTDTVTDTEKIFEPLTIPFFDPNTATKETFIQLGFSNKVAANIEHFRSKGGTFRKPEDLYKIYSIDSALVSIVIPFIRIETHANQRYTNTQSTPKTKVIVEINTADSAALVALYGIGPSMAARIIDYRNKLGGFHTLNQLTELWGFDKYKLDELRNKLTIDASLIKYLPINSITYDELKTHPYLRYKQAAAIINYRKQHGNYTSIDAIKNVRIIPDSTLNKLAPYIKLN